MKPAYFKGKFAVIHHTLYYHHIEKLCLTDFLWFKTVKTRAVKPITKNYMLENN